MRTGGSPGGWLAETMGRGAPERAGAARTPAGPLRAAAARVLAPEIPGAHDEAPVEVIVPGRPSSVALPPRPTMTSGDAPLPLSPTARRRTMVIDIATVVVMGLSSIATAWSSYQASLWSGVQSEAYARASGLRVESSRASGVASTLTTIDVSVFTSWVDATARGEEALAAFYEARFRDEFRPAFDAWVATRPLQNEDAPASPFQMSEYRISQAIQADSLLAAAEATFEDGREANRVGDRYVLTLVLFATVLFLTGLTQKLHSPTGMALLTLAALLFLGAVWGLASLPRL